MGEALTGLSGLLRVCSLWAEHNLADLRRAFVASAPGIGRMPLKPYRRARRGPAKAI